jgi:hypothetical protein
MEENTRLSDLTRMLLSSPSFSGFLDTLSQNPAAAQQVAPAPVQQQQQVERKVRKDVNPYSAQQNMQQIGMTMIPEQHMDFSMLDLNSESFYQPQVFSVLSMPETLIDVETLSGKKSNFVPMASDVEKVEIPVIDRAPASPVKAVEVVDDQYDSDPAFALFAASSPAPVTTVTKPQELDISDLIASISVKPVQYELVVLSSTSDDEAEAAMRKVERLAASLDRMTESLQHLTAEL